MINELIPPSLVCLDATGLHTPHDVLRMAAEMMVSSGKVKAGYTDELLATYETMGAYFVIAPGIALPHTRPSSTVNESGVCFIRLKEPVAFNHPENDPVKLVFLLVGKENDSHLEMIKHVARLLDNSEIMSRLNNAETYEELVRKNA